MEDVSRPGAAPQGSDVGAFEPLSVREARRTIREWELRDGHQAYANPIEGGHYGYQARCWDCDWKGAVYARGDEEWGTEESRNHKQNARREANEHRKATKPHAPSPAGSGAEPEEGTDDV